MNNLAYQFTAPDLELWNMAILDILFSLFFQTQ